MKSYASYQINLIAPYISQYRSVLDFGCGDLALIRGLQTYYPSKKFSGVDVVDSGVLIPGVAFALYDGKKLPFGQKIFDASIVYHVFHHCDHPRENLIDVMRVTKKRIIVVEPIIRRQWELPFMKIADRLGNGWRNVSIPMPFTFQTRVTWRRWIKDLGWKIEEERPVGVLPRFFPIGETVLFSLVHQ